MARVISNKPICHCHRDCAIRMDGNGEAAPNYHPNSFDGIIESQESELPAYTGIGPVGRHDHRSDADYYSQPGAALFRLVNPAQKQFLINNIVSALKDVPEFIQKRQIEHL